MRAGRARQGGVALITALVVVVICSMIASDMLWSTFLDQRRTATVLQGTQAREYARGAEDWVGHLLRMDREETETDHLEQQWAEEITALPLDDHGTLSGRLLDQQGLFNLNNLVQEDGTIHQESYEQFQRLLMLLGFDPDLVNPVVDWIDPDQEPMMPLGAEDGEYLRRDPAHRTADQPMQSTSELRMIEGFDDEILEALKPYVTALPTMEHTPINVNTAPPLVLATLADNMSERDGEFLAEGQADGGYRAVDQFHEIAERNIPVEISVTTDFFKLEGRVEVGDASVSMYSLLARDEMGGTMTIRRTYGTR